MLYGNVTNRMREGRNLLNRPVQVGDDATMYMWSDRHCYYVVEVIDANHVKVKPYHVCADRSKPGGQGHQNWLYFKSANEMNRYLNSALPDSDLPTDLPEDRPEEWVFIRGKWCGVVRYTPEGLARAMRISEAKSRNRDGSLARLYFDGGRLTDKQYQKVLCGKEVMKYHPLEGKVTFGVREYYYDWEF